MKLCESCGEDEVLWLDTTSGDPPPEEQHLCLSCYDNYPYKGQCRFCGTEGWVDTDNGCWGCTYTDDGPVWSWLCRECDTNPVEHKLDTCEECQAEQESSCEVCRGEKDLEDVVAGMYAQVELCDICNCEGRALMKEHNLGICNRCHEYARRIDTQHGPLCFTCNNRGEL